MAEEAKDASIDVSAYADDMIKVIERYELGAGNLIFVDGFPNEANPFRIGKVSKLEKKLYFKRNITPEERAAARKALYRFEEKDLRKIDDDWSFVKHVLLHQIVHILARNKDCYDCDKWAFYELKF
ncbi:MAG: hypothetical protein HZB22_04140 [Deltaproteobacteria bacterium]|nr:hypothetical protein [Deltaproteobacteria bacterium]